MQALRSRPTVRHGTKRMHNILNAYKRIQGTYHNKGILGIIKVNCNASVLAEILRQTRHFVWDPRYIDLNDKREEGTHNTQTGKRLSSYTHHVSGGLSDQ
jgi:hypothetical protein